MSENLNERYRDIKVDIAKKKAEVKKATWEAWQLIPTDTKAPVKKREANVAAATASLQEELEILEAYASYYYHKMKIEFKLLDPDDY